MQTPAVPRDEPARLAALQRYQILDTPAEPDFDDFTSLAASICKTPIALISLVDSGRQWFKSRVGLDVPETPREISFCAHAIHGRDVFEVPDAHQDWRFRDNPVVVSEPYVRFYAGAPLVTPEGHAIGTLCVVDRVPRHLDPEQQDALRKLSRQVITLLEQRDANSRLAGQVGFNRALIASASEAIVSMTPDGVITSLNPAAECLLGLHAGEVVGKDSLVGYHDQAEMTAMRHELARELQREVEDGFDVLIAQAQLPARNPSEWTWLRRGGGRKPVRLSVTPIHDARGQVGGYLAVGRDNAPLKQAESELRAARERLELALAGSRLMMWDYNVEKGELFVDVRWADIAGGDRRDRTMRFEELRRIVHPDDFATADDALRRAFKSGVYLAEYRIRHRRGSWRWIQSHGMVTERTASGRVVRMTGTNADVTEHKLAEQKLRTAALEQTALFNSSPAGIVLVKDRHIARCNDAKAHMFGYELAEMIGMPTKSLYATQSDWERIGHEAYLKMRAGDIYISEAEYRRKNGERFWGLLQGALVDVSAPDRGAIFSVTDISSQKRIMEELNAAKERAEAASCAKSDFLSSMSHELRTPLNAVLGFAQLLELEMAEHPEDARGQWVGHIMKSGQHLLDLINDLLDLAKLEAGRLDIELQPVSLAETIGESIVMLQNSARERDVAVSVATHAEDIPRVSADPQRLKLVVVNLLSNAIKYNRRGGSVTISLHTLPDVVRMSVADTGNGIGEAKMESLFQPFERLGVRSAAIEGPGLGLVICKRLVDLMAGKIGVDSEVGVGSTFWVELPADGIASHDR